MARPAQGSKSAAPATLTDATVPPAEMRELVLGVGYLAAGANVIMQLARLPVGHGVARSTVDSGRVERHPLKRLRTTTSYLMVAIFGTDHERAVLRREIDRVHAMVRSSLEDPVAYSAFDPDLQLWVAACLYEGLEDLYRRVHGGHADQRVVDEVIYPWSARLATTLQVPGHMWPTDREGFDAYWEAGVSSIELDDLTRSYLHGIAGASFVVARLGPLRRPLEQLLGPIARFFALGFLAQPFREQLGLPWSDRQQRRFDGVVRAAFALARRLPRPVREFPFNLYLWDARRRIRSGRPLL